MKSEVQSSLFTEKKHTAILANECAKGAKEAGHDVELLSLKGKNIKYCIGSCLKNWENVILNKKGMHSS